ncbi:regulator of microtubule dynamics protein 1-like [Lytechinus variegatus]|uniref:regulator of microtubule dynamics protein 1-like n=1 Tax=Lytechinus variegatus TaxID=7654 RepID=UPI001BB0F251|nr:regulator of microtubule dynamics protein 1-like [Lytechinus variegatus]
MAGRIGLHRYSLLLGLSQRMRCQDTVRQLRNSWKVSRLWQVCARHSTKLKLGSVFTTSLTVSRGFSLWSSKPKETVPVAEPVSISPDVAAAEEADRLYDANKSTELYDHLVRFKDTTNDELLWRLARACRCVAQLSSTSKEDKKRLTYESLDFAQRALKANDNNFASHKWYAICLSEVGDYEGMKQKILNAFVIKDHFLTAIELNPQDATSVHLLGLWYFTFADMAWYQRKIASAVFTSPPTGTYEEALRMFLSAEKVSPNFYSKNLLMLGKTYQKTGDNKSALLYLTKARDYPVKTEEDNQVKEEAKAILASMGHK